ncbi:MAG: hypothetical protein RLY43_159, partial [Bacteroidota bacterium]
LADPEFVKRLPDIPKTLMRLRRLPGSPDSLSIDDLIEKLK